MNRPMHPLIHNALPYTHALKSTELSQFINKMADPCILQKPRVQLPDPPTLTATCVQMEDTLGFRRVKEVLEVLQQHVLQSQG